MLEDAIHDMFYKGGEWPIMRMTLNHPGPKNTHWKAPETSTNAEYLQLGYQERPITITSTELPKEARLCN
jgi:hypothetical protein